MPEIFSVFALRGAAFRLFKARCGFYLPGMEHNTAPSRGTTADARTAADMSLVDCLFAMPEQAAPKRASREQKADAPLHEARLAAEMRSLIAARLRGDAG